MSEAEEPREIPTPESVWVSMEKEQTSMPIAITPDQLNAMARSRERLNTYLVPAAAAVGAAIAAGLLYNVYKIEQPWIRVGQAWTLGVLIYLFAVQRGGNGRRDMGEPCARYLERQHQQRRASYLRIQRRLFLFLPGIAACWWGRPSPATAADSWLFAITGTALILAWFAFGKAAEKAKHDRDALIRDNVGYGTTDKRFTA